ncbi:Panacea domain-containing protein [Staphylococcus epidermidis]|uniref:Panacea domain-containing protein n=1 Tax=Staphylococcus epidermidis TaxID=1282 RepID=UPI000B31DACA
MYKHYLIFLEEDKKDRRVAFHKLIDSKEDFEEISKYKKELKKLDIEFYTHIITTKDKTVASIEEKDRFFKGVFYVEVYDDFLELAKSTEKLSAMDIVKYILMLKPTTPLKLQKLLYIVYERYILKTQELLFDEKFVAYDYGPVVEQVYSKYRGQRELLHEDDDKSVYSIETEAITPVAYKIFAKEDGKEISQLIKDVVEEYSQCTAWDMVKKTHEIDTAWHRAYNKGQNTEITPEIIKKSISVK